MTKFIENVAAMEADTILCIQKMGSKYELWVLYFTNGCLLYLRFYFLTFDSVFVLRSAFHMHSA